MRDEAARAQEPSILEGLKTCSPDLSTLLSIVNSGDLSRLPDFLKSHQELLKEHRRRGARERGVELNEGTLLEHARLLALAKLCSSHSLMSYESIAKELEVPKTDAEQFIVKAVQLGLVEGRMDQIQEEFAVTRTECIVVEGEWENMRKRIQMWKKNVQFVLDNCNQIMEYACLMEQRGEWSLATSIRLIKSRPLAPEN